MRVLMISKALVMKAYHKKLEELSKMGVELHVVVPKRWGSQRLEVQHSNGYKIYPGEIVLTGKNHFHFYKRLSDVFNKVEPDIVHIDEEYYSLVTFQAMRLAKKMRAKSLFFTWQNIYKNYPFPFSYIEKYNLREAYAAIAGNEEAKKILREKGYKNEIVVIPQFGVDPDIFRKMDSSGLKEQLDLGKDSLVIGFIGRLVEEKGLLVLIAAAAKLQNDFKLLLVGSGPLKNDILKNAKEFGLEDRVRVVPQVPSIDVPPYLNCLDCLVLPSLTRLNWKEQFGRVIIEAMACQVTVIGSDSGEIPGIIGDAGIICKENNRDDLKEKIELVLTDDGLRNTMGKRGRDRILSNYTQKKVAENTITFYKRLLEN